MKCRHLSVYSICIFLTYLLYCTYLKKHYFTKRHTHYFIINLSLANLFILLFITITFFIHFIYLNKRNIITLRQMYTYTRTALPNGYL